MEKINGRTPEEIKHVAEWNCYSCGGLECDDCSYLDACTVENRDRAVPDALALIERLESERDAALAKVPKWIDVKEQPPEFPCLYWDGINQIGITKSLATITMKSGKTVYLSDMLLRAFPDIKQSDVDSCTHILYWMPLPNPPEEDAHE